MNECECERTSLPSGAHFHLGDHESAVSDASSALALDPGYGKAYHRRAAAKRAMGDVEGAGKDYDGAIAAAPGNAELKAEKKAMFDEVRKASLKPARQGPMVIEEIEEEEEAPAPAPAPTPRAKPAAAGRKKIQIQEDSDDEEDEEQPPAAAASVVPPTPAAKAKPAAAAAAASAPPTESRRKIAIVEDDDDDSSDEEEDEQTAGKNVASAAEREAAEAIKKAGDEAFKRGDMEAAESLYTGCLASPGGSGDDTVALAVHANRAAARIKLEKYAEVGWCELNSSFDPREFERRTASNS